ncbi:MAG TPA: cell division protein FtsZ [Edaphocola sp.]|nr:cell division protein FtsZ [Edaphocola sp.]
MIQFESPKNQSSIIKVIGVGGGGGNAVNYMYGLGIDGVDFVVCNTDSQALTQSEIPNKIQLGPHLTQGLGAGANPDIGRQAGEESIEDIIKILKVKTRMAFITAGMGGGTGTGGAPIIAKVCKDLDILTVGIVTTPFTYEGRKRLKQAQEGIAAMREHVDTILIISNDKLRQQYGNLPFTQAFAKADNVLATAAKCITDLITVDGKVNLDFNDVQTVMKNGGVAILGSAQAEGDDRAKTAVVEALNSPLLNDNEIQGAKWILLNVTSAAGDFEHTLDELEIIQAYVQEQAGNTCDIILGMGHDPNLGEKLAVTIIATGFQHHEINTELPPLKSQEPEKVVVALNQENAQELVQAKPDNIIAQQTEDPMAPRLLGEGSIEQPERVDEPQLKTAFSLELPQSPAADQPEATKAVNGVSAQQNNAVKPERQPEEMELVIKNTMPQASVQQTAQSFEPFAGRTVPSYTMSEREKEEQRIFEEQKRALEERAERLRRMSFNFQNRQSSDEMEHIPAYMRQNVNIEESAHSSDNYLSGYYVEGKDGSSKDASIRTINTFLDGKKPD